MSLAKRHLATFAVLFGLATLGCNKKDPGDLREWSPTDHDNQGAPQPGQVDTTQPRTSAMPSLEQHGINDVVLATWKQNCVPCHGVIGRGDGPQGVGSRPKDLTDPNWQRVAIDSEIVHTIKKGRGKMPAFAQIPDETVLGLVRLVRMLNASPKADESGATPAPAPTATP